MPSTAAYEQIAEVRVAALHEAADNSKPTLAKSSNNTFERRVGRLVSIGGATKRW